MRISVALLRDVSAPWIATSTDATDSTVTTGTWKIQINILWKGPLTLMSHKLCTHDIIIYGEH